MGREGRWPHLRLRWGGVGDGWGLGGRHNYVEGGGRGEGG